MERLKKKSKFKNKVFKKSNKRIDKFYHFLRRRIVSRFKVPDDIPILTEDCEFFRQRITFETKYKNNVKYNNSMIIRPSIISTVILVPHVAKNLNVKTVLKYRCILFNKKKKYELIYSLIRLRDTRVKSIKLLSECPKCITEPFVFVLNGWDDDYILNKEMDTGKKINKEDGKAMIEADEDYEEQIPDDFGLRLAQPEARTGVAQNILRRTRN